jgi:hypothetical protein
VGIGQRSSAVMTVDREEEGELGGGCEVVNVVWRRCADLRTAGQHGCIGFVGRKGCYNAHKMTIIVGSGARAVKETKEHDMLRD